MAHLLSNKNIVIEIDAPLENYKSSRFDWTGKITTIKFKNVTLTGIEDPNCSDENLIGKGLYNEFGIDTALGFEEAEIGEWFHKIGVGLLKKEDSNYAFHKSYEIEPAKFQLRATENSILISCVSLASNGYSYELQKELTLQENSITIKYHLKNTGIKPIHTEEYTHNFLAINEDLIAEEYQLNFPFNLQPKLFGETVNSELAVSLGKNKITFNSTPNEQFFFSNLTGGKRTAAAWELVNLNAKIGIREKASFQTKKVNLWGWKHVISPELFHEIKVEPGKSTTWTRNYELFEI